jgi:hypothetical protein
LIPGAYFVIPKGKDMQKTFITVSRNEGEKKYKNPKSMGPNFELPPHRDTPDPSGHSPRLTLHQTKVMTHKKQ